MTTGTTAGATGPHPTLASLATWLVPGAGHYMLGNVRLAAIGFVVIQGLYLLGVLLSDGLFLSILPPEMRGTFSPVLSPEAGNLGALLAHVQTVGYGGTEPRVWPSTIHVGVALTASSGILNLLLAARAHFDARARSAATVEGAAPHPGQAVLLAWLVPGGGHFLQARRARGLVVFALLVGLFALGTMLAGTANLDRTRHFYYWGGQALLGPIALVWEQVVGHSIMEAPTRYDEAGVVIASIAGMLNVLVMLDVYGTSDARLFGRPVPTESGGDAGATGGVQAGAR
ncbi:MAG: DUF6677 family protein [Planctomycetota bacterium]